VRCEVLPSEILIKSRAPTTNQLKLLNQVGPKIEGISLGRLTSAYREFSLSAAIQLSSNSNGTLLSILF
jgi:hypothetical protein